MIHVQIKSISTAVKKKQVYKNERKAMQYAYSNDKQNLCIQINLQVKCNINR